MLNAKGVLIGNISSDNKIEGKLNNAIEKFFPELEDLVVVPKGEEQHFKSEKYGYDNVTVDVAGGGTLYRQKLTLGETNKAKLTDE